MLEIPIDLKHLCEEWAQAVIQAMPPDQFLPAQQVKQKYTLQLEELLKSKIERFSRGIKILIETLLILNKINPSDFPDTLFSELDKMAISERPSLDSLKKNLPLKDYYGLSEHALNLFYQAANYLFKNGSFQNCADTLFFLCHLDPENELFWLALGNVEYHSEHYEDALNAFSIAYLINEQDPRGLLYAAHSCEKLGEKERALGMVQGVLEICETDTGLREIRESAQQYIEELKVA